jgi:hypothetical protein
VQCHPGVDDSLARARGQRLATIVADVQTRLHLICREMPKPLFHQMVESIALVQLKYEKDLFLTDRVWT